MEEAFNLLARSPEVILCGDFNFDNNALQENQVYMSHGYADVLTAFVPGKGYGSFTKLPTFAVKGSRPDKVLLRQSALLQPYHGFICGNFATPLFEQNNEPASQIEYDDLVRTPSDHMCVVVDLYWKAKQFK